jgi:hypothetical protein
MIPPNWPIVKRLEVVGGAVGVPGDSVEQMILPSLLTLNADHRAIGGFHVGFSIKSYPDGKIAGLIAPKDLNAGDGLATWPMFHGFKALFAQSRIVKAECLDLCHACKGEESDLADGMGGMLQGKPDTRLTTTWIEDARIRATDRLKVELGARDSAELGGREAARGCGVGAASIAACLSKERGSPLRAAAKACALGPTISLCVQTLRSLTTPSGRVL